MKNLTNNSIKTVSTVMLLVASTTVLHVCRTITEVIETDKKQKIEEKRNFLLKLALDEINISRSHFDEIIQNKKEEES